ncbi:MAG: cytochrome c-type biogenesis protein CcmH [Paracoccaceae bacterium]|nr:cytochrome c-type biogenesis protein CcmH [Paracoccaceae bacterium]
MRVLLIVVFALFAFPGFAVEPNEIIADEGLEARARVISKGLRCPVCQNESIDESSASLAADLRMLVRERLIAGDSDEEVFDFVVRRYGEFVLLAPSTSGANIVLWIAAPAMLWIGLMFGIFFIRSRSKFAGHKQDRPLDSSEKAELEKILNR